MARRPAAQIRRFPPGLDVKLSDVLKSYPPPKGDSHVCTDDQVLIAAADKSNKEHCKVIKGNSKPPQCPDCWFPEPPLCTKCCGLLKMHDRKTK